jgi:hypothetical protein
MFLSSPLTPRQAEFLRILHSWNSWKENKNKPMPRSLMRKYIGLGVDNIALQLSLKGYIEIRKEKDGRVYYVLRQRNLE